MFILIRTINTCEILYLWVILNSIIKIIKFLLVVLETTNNNQLGRVVCAIVDFDFVSSVHLVFLFINFSRLNIKAKLG